MINAIKQYFADAFDNQVYEDEQKSLRMACTVMMFEVLRSDAHTHPEELVKISQHIQRAFDLDEDETAILMQQAQHETEHAVSLHDVIRAVNEEYGAEEKRNLVRMLWDVAYADGRLDPYEEHTIRKLADWLHVPHRVFILTKHEAAETD